jgi:hypothetical protein
MYSRAYASLYIVMAVLSIATIYLVGWKDVDDEDSLS